MVEGSHYFPLESVKRTPAILRNPYHLPLERVFFLLDLSGKRQRKKDAAWYYPEPKDSAKQIKDRVAFRKGVEVKQ